MSVLHPLAGVLGCDHGGRPHLGRRPEHRVQGRGGVPQRRLQGHGGGVVPQSHLNLNFNLQCFIIFNEFLHTFNSSLGKLTRPSSTIAGSTPAPTEASSVVSITITGHWIISWILDGQKCIILHNYNYTIPTLIYVVSPAVCFILDPCIVVCDINTPYSAPKY